VTATFTHVRWVERCEECVNCEQPARKKQCLLRSAVTVELKRRKRWQGDDVNDNVGEHEGADGGDADGDERPHAPVTPACSPVAEQKRAALVSALTPGAETTDRGASDALGAELEHRREMLATILRALAQADERARQGDQDMREAERALAAHTETMATQQAELQQAEATLDACRERTAEARATRDADEQECKRLQQELYRVCMVELGQAVDTTAMQTLGVALNEQVAKLDQSKRVVEGTLASERDVEARIERCKAAHVTASCAHDAAARELRQMELERREAAAEYLRLSDPLVLPQDAHHPSATAQALNALPLPGGCFSGAASLGMFSGTVDDASDSDGDASSWDGRSGLHDPELCRSDHWM